MILSRHDSVVPACSIPVIPLFVIFVSFCKNFSRPDPNAFGCGFAWLCRRSRRGEGVLPKCRSATGPRSQRPERGPTCGNLANFHTRTRCERGPFALRLRFSHLGNTPSRRLLQCERYLN